MRRYAGIVSLVVTALLLSGFWIFDAALVWRLLLFIPATGAAIGFMQDRLHFCARFGMSGLFNFSNNLKNQEGVEKAEYRRKDQRKAITIIGSSILIGIVIMVIGLL